MAALAACSGTGCVTRKVFWSLRTAAPHAVLVSNAVRASSWCNAWNQCMAWGCHDITCGGGVALYSLAGSLRIFLLYFLLDRFVVPCHARLSTPHGQALLCWRHWPPDNAMCPHPKAWSALLLCAELEELTKAFHCSLAPVELLTRHLHRRIAHPLKSAMSSNGYHPMRIST